MREFKRVNRDERTRQMRLFAATTEPWQQLGNFAASLMNLDQVGDDSIDGVREKERLYEQAVRSGDYLDGRFWADTWVRLIRLEENERIQLSHHRRSVPRIERNPHACEPWMRQEIERLAGQYHFFHWHLAFRMCSTSHRQEANLKTNRPAGNPVLTSHWESTLGEGQAI